MKLFKQIKILFTIVFFSAAVSGQTADNLIWFDSDVWKDGKVSGLMARGGFVVDMNWKNGKLTEAIVHSKLGGKAKVQYGGKIIEMETKKGKNYRFNEALSQNRER